MSPPQVDHCVKPSPLVSEEEMPIEKKDKTDADSIITVETKGKKNCKNLSRRCRVICCLAVIAVLAVTVAVVLGVKFGLRDHGEDYDYDDYDYGYTSCDVDYSEEGYGERNCTFWTCLLLKTSIYECVLVEEDLQLIHAEHAHGTDGEPPMHLLYDYLNHMAAYKDKDRNVCYITVLEETFAEGLNRWHLYDKLGRYRKPLLLPPNSYTEPEEVKSIAGESIYTLCENAQSFWAERIEEVYVTSPMTIVKV